MPQAYCTNLAKWLNNILSPFIPKSRTVKDSFEFIEKLSSNNYDLKNAHLVSFDVKSLFTNIPVEETVNYICQCAPENQLPIRTNTLKELLLLACKNILFSFNNKNYVQFDGMCMGSNLGPTMAAFMMDKIENKMPNTPQFYCRYVDDIFTILKSPKEAENFLTAINQIHPNIQFTKEEENDKKIVLLDVEVNHQEQLITKWHLKETNNEQYLHKHAYAPQSYKYAAIKSLICLLYTSPSPRD